MTNFIFSKVAGIKSTGPLKNDLHHIHSLRILPRSYLITFSQNTFRYCCLYFTWDSFHARLKGQFKAWSYKKKKHKKIKAYRKSLQKEPTVKRCLLILDLNPFRSWVKGQYSIGREFQSLAVQGKELLTQPSLQHLRMVTEKSCNLSE